ncbi:MAG: hypothetical protein HDS66_03480 [Bacteroidales bacterium]|nr:hypothetical protein [Bacteroidales bacterium]
MLSCDRQRSRPIYNSVVIDDSSVANDDEAEFSEEVHIPFKIQGGVKTIPVKVNGIGFEMIFDTGCSAALISVAEAQYLYSKGLLTDDDFIDTELNMIADGSIVENMVVNLREVVIGDKLTATDVKATVSSNINAPLLIGNSVLDRVGALTIDNANQELIFHLSD